MNSRCAPARQVRLIDTAIRTFDHAGPVALAGVTGRYRATGVAGRPSTLGHSEYFQGLPSGSSQESPWPWSAPFVDSLFLVARVGVRLGAVVDSALSDLLEVRGVYEEGEVPVAWPAKGVGKRQDGLGA